MTGKDLVSVRSLSMLKDHRIGIDGNVWLKKITQAVSEQYQAGIGGIPSGMRKAIEKELEGFKYASSFASLIRTLFDSQWLSSCSLFFAFLSRSF
jgi:hypothetical protein